MIVILLIFLICSFQYSFRSSDKSNVENYYLVSSYEKGYQYQYKVNLHAHTTERSKNYAYSPKMLMEKAKGYDFTAFAITDLPQAGGIVEDPKVNGILHIPGIEYGGKPHLIGLGIDSFTLSSNKQEQIDHIKSQGGLAYIPHPYWGKYDENLIKKLKNVDGIAVFNSLTYGVAVFEKKASAVISYNESIIDALLSNENNLGIIAEEDTKYEDPHKYGHQLNTAWINVWGNIPPQQLKAKDILSLIKEKRFTSHARHLREHPEPPLFEKIKTDGMTVYVQINKPSEITFITNGSKIKKKFENSKTGSYQIDSDDLYVRIKATYLDQESSWAWTNPIYVKKSNN